MESSFALFWRCINTVVISSSRIPINNVLRQNKEDYGSVNRNEVTTMRVKIVRVTLMVTVNTLTAMTLRILSVTAIATEWTVTTIK